MTATDAPSRFPLPVFDDVTKSWRIVVRSQDDGTHDNAQYMFGVLRDLGEHSVYLEDIKGVVIREYHPDVH